MFFKEVQHNVIKEEIQNFIHLHNKLKKVQILENFKTFNKNYKTFIMQ